MEQKKRLVLGEMVWPEVEREMANIKVAVIPVGSCEQHGPNTTFTTDSERAYEFCKLLGDRVGNKILIAPPVTYGISTHHMPFPTTLTLRIDTMIQMLCDIAEAFSRHGIKKVLFVNGHGGNRPVLNSVVVKLQYEYGIDAYWSAMGTNLARKTLSEHLDLPPVIGHACEVETSQCMYLCPWVVHEDRQPGQLHTNSMYYRKVLCDGSTAWNWKKDASENGALGDATRSTREIGEEMTNIALDYFEKLLDEIIAR
ncbi:creatininase family protein [Colidextribacter sp. OB.20]|uniref:creatininase family protein n=1 Tax=Colidextribacter sp. OB.20 TaxID=2304568 RepID=UPI001367A540|nr:creatininase family protein [Colidextribacter sp. OB.20]NBI08923.1 creatininase family protein [Colidextribacter sp. OB.20]